MTTGIKENKEVIHKRKTWVSLAVNLITILAAGFGSLLPLEDMVRREPLVTSIVGAFMVLLVLTTMVATYIKKGSAKASALGDTLSRAFLESLDRSALNPHREGVSSNG